MKVYLIVESGSWDYENTDSEVIFATYEKAKKNLWKE